MTETYIDLYELQSRLKAGVESTFPGKVWLKAEISALKARPSGHCYMELSQSSDSGIIAKAQAVIWSSKYRFLAPFFKSVTGSDLSEGMNAGEDTKKPPWFRRRFFCDSSGFIRKRNVIF